MQDKELEELLQQKADQIKLRDFSQVWEEIKGEIESPAKPKKKFSWKKRFSIILASAAVLVCAVLAPFVINGLTPQEEVYFVDGLQTKIVTSQEMLDGLSQAQIAHVDLSDYTLTDTKLYVTEDLQVKGAEMIFMDDESNPTFFAIMQICGNDVNANIDLENYKDSIKVNSADVKYKLKQETSEASYYSVYATCNGVQYVIEYTGVSENLNEFLNKFFA